MPCSLNWSMRSGMECTGGLSGLIASPRAFRALSISKNDILYAGFTSLFSKNPDSLAIGRQIVCVDRENCKTKNNIIGKIIYAMYDEISANIYLNEMRFARGF